MTLTPGTHLGPYEILAPLGAGGMGEVWKAKDTRLDRFVAVKVLPEHLAKHPESLARFEREAKAVAALNHPNITGIHDFQTQGETTYVVMELLEGESLRTRLEQGPIAPRKATELAIQMAQGLAAAHEKGVVHRDLKPDNLWITKEGRLKILDFGLAKQLPALGTTADSLQPTAAMSPGHHTEQGVLLGTLGYMSPEQVRGESVDARSDIFSFGVVLFEMLTGKKAFARDTAADTMAAILKEEPPEDGPATRPLSEGLQKMLRHCLEKEPQHRFEGAKDVAFALEAIGSGSAPSVTPSPGAPRTWARAAWLAALGMFLSGLAGYLAPGRRPLGQPIFHLLTHERGTLDSARFVSGSQEVLYSANWAGGPSQWLMLRLGQPGVRTLVGGEGPLLSLAPDGVALGLSKPFLTHGISRGDLFSLPIAGGAPRPWASDVWSACQGTRSGDVAVAIGEYAKEIRLEWPLGQVLLKGYDTLRSLRVRGDQVALFREQGDFLENGDILVVGRGGKARVLATIKGFTGLDWGPNGQEVWISTFQAGESQFLAVDLAGRVRTLLRHAGRLELHDVDPAGRVLATLHSYQRQTYGRRAGEAQDRDLGWLDATAALGLSADGNSLLLATLREWSKSDGTLYIRPLAGGPAKAIGASGNGMASLSSDGKWVTTTTEDPTHAILLIPTGPGSSRRIPVPDFVGNLRFELLPDGKNGVFWGRNKHDPPAFYALNLTTGAVQQISPPSSSPYTYQRFLSPEGDRVAYSGASGQTIEVTRLDGSGAISSTPLGAREAIASWGPGPSSLLVWDRNQLPAEVDMIDLRTGRRTRFNSIQPPDPVGILGVESFQFSRDGRSYAYNITRKLSELYLIEGLK